MSKTEAPRLRQNTVEIQHGVHGGVVVRVPRVTVKDFMMDWNGLKQLATGSELDSEIDKFIDEDMKQIQIFSEYCKTHGYVHIQLVPLGKQPMECKAEKD